MEQIPANTPAGGDNVSAPPKFRFNASKIFLTYSQCNITPEECFTFFSSKWTIISYVIGQEHHQDGNTHLHAYFLFDSKLDLTSSRCFDIAGIHPNIKNIGRSKKDIERVCAYINKEEFNVITNMDFEAKPDYGDILKMAKNKDEFVLLVKKHYPRDYVINLDRILGCANYTFKNTITKYKTPDDYKVWKLPSVLDEWVKYEFEKTNRAKCLILKGESRYGKTGWARSLGHHMFFRGYFSLADWDDTAKYIIFDDMNEMKNHKALLTCMGECILTDKYKGKERIMNNKPAIYLCNEFEQWMENSYWEKNSVKVELENSLF